MFRLVDDFVLRLLLFFVSNNDEHRTKAVALVSFAGDSQILVILEHLAEKRSLFGIGEILYRLCILLIKPS